LLLLFIDIVFLVLIFCFFVVVLSRNSSFSTVLFPKMAWWLFPLCSMSVI
jgi:hypothetical protein